MTLNLSLRSASVRLPKDDADGFPISSHTREALEDLVGGAKRSWIWTKLAYQDIKLRYRGSLLGPFWVTLSNLVMIVAIGVIYGSLFHVDTSEYVPYVATGLIVWQLISTIIIEGCQTFTQAQEIIQQVSLPFSIQAFRVVYRNLLVLAHNAVIIPFGLVFFSVPVTWHIFDIIPALVVLCFDGLWISLFLGMLSARYRDVPPIISSFVQVLFFMTPIFWPMDSIAPQMREILALNPFFAALDVVRAPLLGVAPEPSSWPLLLGCSALCAICGFAFFARFRSRTAYWI